jgi:hypothetical protein
MCDGKCTRDYASLKKKYIRTTKKQNLSGVRVVLHNVWNNKTPVYVNISPLANRLIIPISFFFLIKQIITKFRNKTTMI